MMFINWLEMQKSVIKNKNSGEEDYNSSSNDSSGNEYSDGSLEYDDVLPLFQ